MPKRDDAWPQGTPCWVDCQVDDTTAARNYYTALFGWDVQDNAADAGGYLMALLDGSPAAGIGAKSEGMDMPSAWTTYFAAESADAVAALVTSAGGQIVVPPFDVLDVGRMLVAADPTGAVFGVWEAKAHNGAGIYNENGAYCWNELHTRDYATAQKFYEAVFGFTYNEIGDGTNFVYSTFALPTGGDGVGGVLFATDTIGGKSDEEQIRATAQDFVDTMNNKGFEAAVANSCDAVKSDFKTQSQEERDLLRQAKFRVTLNSVTDIKINGDTATAKVDGKIYVTFEGKEEALPDDDTPTEFKKEGGEWKMCSDPAQE